MRRGQGRDREREKMRSGASGVGDNPTDALLGLMERGGLV